MSKPPQPAATLEERLTVERVVAPVERLARVLALGLDYRSPRTHLVAIHEVLIGDPIMGPALEEVRLDPEHQAKLLLALYAALGGPA